MGDNILADYLFNSTDYNNGSGGTIFDSDVFSGNNNDLSKKEKEDATGSGNWSTANVASKGLSFSAYNGSFSYNSNNSSYWETINTSNVVNKNIDFSVCIWFNNIKNEERPDRHDSIFSNSNLNDKGFQITARVGGAGTVGWKVNVDDNNGLSWDITNYSNVAGWHNIAITYSNSTQKLYTYYDSIETANYNGVDREIANFTTIKLASNRQSQQVWNGLIGPTRVYSGKVLTQQEIENIYFYNAISGEGGVFGDPHIKTIKNTNYKFDYFGSFRLFDNNDKNNRLIINGESNFGLGRWRKNQYIRKIYIKYCDKEMLIDTGFRGHKVKVIENNGIKYDEFDLDLSHEAYNYCFYCKQKFSLDFDINEHKTDIHQMFIPVRNKIIVDLDDFELEITNVNKFNLQPCRIFLIPKIPLNIKWSGCLVDRKHALKSKLDNLKQISDCLQERIEIENEKLPSSINSQWE